MLLTGDRVEVTHPISEMERTLLGKRFVIDRFDETHGYAVVKDEWGAWHVHPESLTLVDWRCIGATAQSEDTCVKYADRFGVKLRFEAGEPGGYRFVYAKTNDETKIEDLMVLVE